MCINLLRAAIRKDHKQEGKKKKPSEERELIQETEVSLNFFLIIIITIFSEFCIQNLEQVTK